MGGNHAGAGGLPNGTGGAVGGGGQGAPTGGATGGGVAAGGKAGATAGGGGGHAGTNVAGGGGHATGGAGGMPVSGSPCRSNDQCGPSGALTCLAPGEFAGCGNCRQGQSTCEADTDCAGGFDAGAAGAPMICEFAPNTDCYCTGVKICQLGCRTKSDCGPGQGCNALHFCQNTCTPGAAFCPANSACGENGFCIQKTCTSDSQCAGACVKGRCYDTPGTCQSRPA